MFRFALCSTLATVLGCGSAVDLDLDHDPSGPWAAPASPVAGLPPLEVTPPAAEPPITGELGASMVWHALTEPVAACLSFAGDPQAAARCGAIDEGDATRVEAVWQPEPIERGAAMSVESLVWSCIVMTTPLAYGVITVFVDGDEDWSLDRTSGEPSVDRVVAASAVPGREDLPRTYLVWRATDDLRGWALFETLAGCEAPPHGFSVVEVAPHGAGCRVIDVFAEPELPRLPVHWVDEAASLACAPAPRAAYGYPEARLPTGAQVRCESKRSLVWHEAGACAPERVYDLVGCADTTSPEACERTAWDLSASPPTWWPCR